MSFSETMNNLPAPTWSTWAPLFLACLHTQCTLANTRPIFTTAINNTIGCHGTDDTFPTPRKKHTVSDLLSYFFYHSFWELKQKTFVYNFALARGHQSNHQDKWPGSERIGTTELLAHRQSTILLKAPLHDIATGPCFNVKTVFLGTGIHVFTE